MGVRTIAYPPSTALKQPLAAISPSGSSLSSPSGIVAGSRQHSARSSPTGSLLCSRRNGARRTKNGRRRSLVHHPGTVIVYAVVDDTLSPGFPLAVELEVFIRRKDAERFTEEVRGDD